MGKRSKRVRDFREQVQSKEPVGVDEALAQLKEMRSAKFVESIDVSVNLGIDPKIMYYGLLCGATLGGNLTPIGASANIAGIGILRKEGHEVKATTFMKYGVPFTLAAVITGYLLIWLIWKP